jgi:hypothetical protein
LRTLSQNTGGATPSGGGGSSTLSLEGPPLSYIRPPLAEPDPFHRRETSCAAGGLQSALVPAPQSSLPVAQSSWKTVRCGPQPARFLWETAPSWPVCIRASENYSAAIAETIEKKMHGRAGKLILGCRKSTLDCCKKRRSQRNRAATKIKVR